MVGRVGERIMGESLMIVQVFPIRQTVFWFLIQATNWLLSWES